MDREPEQRRDLSPAQPGPNPMGGELFTITEKCYVKGWNGQPVLIKRAYYHQAIGEELKEKRYQPFEIGWVPNGWTIGEPLRISQLKGPDVYAIISQVFVGYIYGDTPANIDTFILTVRGPKLRDAEEWLAWWRKHGDNHQPIGAKHG